MRRCNLPGLYYLTRMDCARLRDLLTREIERQEQRRGEPGERERERTIRRLSDMLEAVR